jgi:CDGSH-type Zn-finger protein/uncharacterized Fe-S cluster protein YjdI
MNKKYTGTDQDRRYRGDQIDVTYNLGRCIHARECVRNLPAVFDTARRPWILPDTGEVETLTRVIQMCPSGALHYLPKDGSAREPIPGVNTVVLRENSYLEIRGNLRISGSNVEIPSETRVTICRCGASKNKPFCDNSHLEIQFQAPPPHISLESGETDASEGGELLITLNSNGPIELSGNFEIRTDRGELVYRGTNEWLCRCGSSQNKPFCDSSHRRNGFVAP